MLKIIWGAREGERKRESESSGTEWKIGASTEIQSANDKNSFAYISRDVRRETHARKRKKERESEKSEKKRNEKRREREREKRKPGGPGFINTLEDKLASWLHDLIITASSLLFRLISLRLARKRRQPRGERERERGHACRDPVVSRH